jgi:endoglucanase
VAVLIETMRRLKSGPNEMYFVFTAQQEIGGRGAGAAAYSIDPEVGIAVEVTPAGDSPHSAESQPALGHGPAVRVKDESMLADPRVVKWMTRTAERAGIAIQREVRSSGTGDASAIQIARAGVPVGCLAMPVRYLHSPSEMIAIDDLENCVRLLAAMLRSTAEV